MSYPDNSLGNGLGELERRLTILEQRTKRLEEDMQGIKPLPITIARLEAKIERIAEISEHPPRDWTLEVVRILLILVAALTGASIPMGLL